MREKSLFLILWFIRYFYDNYALQDHYLAHCVFTIHDNITSFNGNVALYSMEKSFEIQGNLFIFQDDLCVPIKNLDINSNKMIGLVRRGNCSFEIKSQNAAILGYEGLIIVNTDLQVFPPGGTSTNLLPTIMISESFWSYYQELCKYNCPNINAFISYCKYG